MLLNGEKERERENKKEREGELLSVDHLRGIVLI